MSELELKHLVPYLPYKIRVYDTVIKKQKITNIGQGSSCNWVGLKTVLNYYNSGNFIYIPILRPLSDLTKEIVHNGEKFIPINYNAFKNDKVHLIEFQNKFYHYKSVKYGILERLFEWHFDVFGLIEQGLAIDINTLEL